ncbi:MAG: hypothetical protein K1X57_22200, partial [Gemmataceae bacterium]|nr:hypothetical protein [Gemmataceae bacterium]
MASDMSGNAVVSIGATEALQALEFTADVVRPSLRSFVLDMDTGVVSLSFSETVRVSTFGLQHLRLANAAAAGAVEYGPTSAIVAPMINSPVVNVTLSLDDTNNIKALPSLATSLSNTYVQIGEGLIRDMSNNSVEELAALNALGVSRL